MAWVFWPGGGLLDPFDVPKGLACAFSFVVFLGLLVWERTKIPPEGGTMNHGVLWVGAGLILIGMILSSIFSAAPVLGLKVTLREMTFVLAGVAIAGARPRRAEVRWVIGCFLVSAAAQSGLALMQYFWLDGVSAMAPNLALGRGARGAMIGTIGNPEYMAGWLAPALVASAIAFHESERRKRPKWLYLVAMILSILAIYFSSGRGAFLSAFYSGIFAILLLRDDSNVSWKKRMRAGLVPRSRLEIAILILLLIFGITSFLRPIEKTMAVLPGRIGDMFNFQSDSMRHRIGLYTVTTQMILENPVFGAGPGRFGAAYGETQRRLAMEEEGIGYWAQANMLAGAYVGEAHCDPLQWWAEYGLLPILGLSLMLAAALGRSRRELRGNPEIAAMWGGLLALALTMWVSFPLHEASRAMLFWVMIGMLAGGAAGEPGIEKGNEKE